MLGVRSATKPGHPPRWDGELVADVLDGAQYKDGVKVTDDEDTTTDEKVAA